jgi:hypothetical protein
MRKNIIWIITLTILIVLFVLIVKPIRTMKVMESIAKNELMDEPFYLFTDKYKNLYKNVEGPIVIYRQDRVQFTWYKVLEWGDTASISAFLYKNFLIEFTGIFRSQNPSSVTADTKWYYVYVPEGISKFTEILPKRYDSNATDVSVFKLCPKQGKIADSINFIINPNRLLFFLKKGHFFIVEKNDIYTIIDFYEPIANINHRHTNESISTMSAKVFFNDSLEVLIMPYVVPVDLRNKQ